MQTPPLPIVAPPGWRCAARPRTARPRGREAPAIGQEVAQGVAGEAVGARRWAEGLELHGVLDIKSAAVLLFLLGVEMLRRVARPLMMVYQGPHFLYRVYRKDQYVDLWPQKGEAEAYIRQKAIAELTERKGAEPREEEILRVVAEFRIEEEKVK